MTRQEALEWFKTYKPVDGNSEAWEAYEWAIKALSESEITYDRTLAALHTVRKFLEDEGVYWSETEWEDEYGDGFDTDQGYFIEGLDGFEKYLLKKVNSEDQE